jgi:hypothetical protein
MCNSNLFEPPRQLTCTVDCSKISIAILKDLPVAIVDKFKILINIDPHLVMA